MITKAMAAIARRLSRLSDDEFADISRRAHISARQMRRLRAGKLADMKFSAVLRLAEAMRVTPSELGGSSPQPKRPAPIGRRLGRMRNARRKVDIEDPPLYFEDEEQED